MHRPFDAQPFPAIPDDVGAVLQAVGLPVWWEEMTREWRYVATAFSQMQPAISYAPSECVTYKKAHVPRWLWELLDACVPMALHHAASVCGGRRAWLEWVATRQRAFSCAYRLGGRDALLAVERGAHG